MNLLNQLEKGLISRDAAETHAVAERLAAHLPVDCTLALSGQLGTGKTTFVQGLARAWGIRKSVTSPTFNLYTIYDGQRRLIHFDAYRLGSPSEADDLLIEDFLRSPYCLAVEWPEKVGGWLPEPVMHLFFAIVGEGEHAIQLVNKDARQG